MPGQKTTDHAAPSAAPTACPNETIRQLHERKSVRAFTPEPVSVADERAVLEAACQAPTAGNEQLYSIIVVRDQAKKDALAASCDNQPFIAKAPLVLAFCADVRRWRRGFALAGADPREPGAGDFLLAVEDTMIAAQNAVVAAHSLDLGSCYIGDILENCEEQARILGCPRWGVPVSVLVIGHPAPAQLRRRKPGRFPLEGIVFENEYRDLPEDELRALLATKEGQTADADRGFEEWLGAFCARKWNSGFCREMTRSARSILEAFGPGEDAPQNLPETRE